MLVKRQTLFLGLRTQQRVHQTVPVLRQRVTCTIKHRKEGFSDQVTFEQRPAEEGTSHTDKRKEPQLWAKGTIGAPLVSSENVVRSK